MAFHNLRRAYFTGEKFVPDPGSFGDDGRPLVDFQSIVDLIARDQAEKQPEEQFATAEGNVTFEELIKQCEMEQGREPDTPQPVPLPSALDGSAPSTEQPFGGIDMEPLSRLSEDEEGMGPMEPVPGMEPGTEPTMESGDDMAEYIHKQIQMELGKTDEGVAGELPSADDLIPEEDEIGADDDDYEGAFDEAGDILGPETGDIDLGVPVAEDEDSDFELPAETQDALESGEMEEIFPDDKGETEDEAKDYGLAKAILKGKERKMAAAIARKVVADTINIDFTFNDEGKPEVNIDEGEEGLGLGDEDLLDEEEGEGEDLFGEEGEGEDLFGEEAGPKGKGDDLFDELGGGGEGGEGDLFGEEEPGGGGEDEFLGI